MSHCDHIVGLKIDLEDWRDIDFLVTDPEEHPLGPTDEKFHFCPLCGKDLEKVPK